MYENHTTKTSVDIPLTVTAMAQRELHGADDSLAEETPAVIEAYQALIASIFHRKFEDGDIDADGGITITADDVVVAREMLWVPTIGDNGLTPEQEARLKRWCKTGLVDEDMPY
jgi:hypothetical protein